MAHAKHVFLCVRYEGPDVLTFTWYYSEIDLLQSARLRTDNSWLRSRASSESVRRDKQTSEYKRARFSIKRGYVTRLHRTASLTP